MARNRTLAVLVGTVAIGLVLASAAVAETLTLFESTDWDVILDYEYNDNDTAITSYEETGTYDREIICTGSWEQVDNATTATANDTRRIKWGIDYGLGQLGVEHQDNGSITSKIFACSASLEVKTYRGQTWRQWSDTIGDTSGHIDDRVPCRNTEPATDLCDEYYLSNVSSQEHGAQYWLKVAANATGGVVPFTGEVNNVTVDDQNDTTPDAFHGQSCTAIGGVCWEDGQPGSLDNVSQWSEMEKDVTWESTWVVGGPFDLPAIEAGHVEFVFETYEPR